MDLENFLGESGTGRFPFSITTGMVNLTLNET